MGRNALMMGALAMALSACVSSPKQTVLNLDTTDPKWTSKRCVAARKAVHRFDELQRERGLLGFVGNLAAPMAGTAAAMALSATKDDERTRLNHQVRASCISDPLKGRRAAAKGKARRVASR
jgi:hypothetical protein